MLRIYRFWPYLSMVKNVFKKYIILVSRFGFRSSPKSNRSDLATHRTCPPGFIRICPQLYEISCYILVSPDLSILKNHFKNYQFRIPPSLLQRCNSYLITAFRFHRCSQLLIAMWVMTDDVRQVFVIGLATDLLRFLLDVVVTTPVSISVVVLGLLVGTGILTAHALS